MPRSANCGRLMPLVRSGDRLYAPRAFEFVSDHRAEFAVQRMCQKEELRFGLGTRRAGFGPLASGAPGFTLRHTQCPPRWLRLPTTHVKRTRSHPQSLERRKKENLRNAA